MGKPFEGASGSDGGGRRIAEVRFVVLVRRSTSRREGLRPLQSCLSLHLASAGDLLEVVHSP